MSGAYSNFLSLALASLIWVAFDETVLTWQLSPGNLGLRGWVIFGIRSLVYLALILLIVIWRGRWTWSRVGNVVCVLLIGLYFATSTRGPLALDVLDHAWRYRTHLAQGYARLIAITTCSLIFLFTLVLSKKILRAEGSRLWLTAASCLALVSWLAASALAGWKYEWTVFFAFAALPLSVVAGLAGSSVVGVILNKIVELMWPLSRLWVAIKWIGLKGKILWWTMAACAVMLYFFLPSPGEAPSTLSRYICLERAPFIFPVPLKRRQECDIRTEMPAYLIARSNTPIPFKDSWNVVDLEAPVRLVNDSGEPFVVEQIGNLSLGIPAGAGYLSVEGGGTFVEFSRGQVAVSLPPKDTKLLVGAVQSLPATFKPVSESVLEELAPALLEELLFELRWGKGWMVAETGRLSVVLKVRRENLEFSQRVMVFVPPEGQSYVPRRSVLQRLYGIREGMSEEEVRRLAPPLPAVPVEKKLEELWQAESRLVRERLGQPLQTEQRVFMTTPLGPTQVSRWKYSCRAIARDVGPLCVFYLSFVGERVLGWRLVPIEEQAFEEAKQRLIRAADERILFKSDALKVLGDPYWRIHNIWYYPMAEAPNNFLLELHFVFGARWDRSWRETIGGEGTERFRGIEIFASKEGEG